ncbi:MAG TPA: TonB-dependent receptor plug domain-containing protein [Williamwhitmania sp.]|nr:TonB-dependent receptor plug domain-containing protein [Williamwhitmania sp.]
MKIAKCFIVVVALMVGPFSPNALLAQVDTTMLSGDRFYDLSLEQLMNIPVEISSKSAVNIRETPGIVSVINQKEMLRAGARDLVDVLTLFVPGMGFGVDVEGVVGVGFHGIWGNEGKVLLLIDGQEANEELFATLQLGGHYPVDMIERVEVIRGPGSAMYGGYASLAVINIITKATGNKAESHGAFLNSFSRNAATHSDFSLGFTQPFTNGVVNFSATEGTGTRATRTWIDATGFLVKLADKSDIGVGNYNLRVAYKGFSIRGMLDSYRLQIATLYGTALNNAKTYDQRFDSYFGEATYTYAVNNVIKIVPKLQYKQQYPWQLQVPTLGYFNKRYSKKVDFDISSTYNLGGGSNILVGSSISRCNILDVASDNLTNNNDFGITNFSAYAQLLLFSKWVNITAGARYDYYNHFGNSLVPRISITRAWTGFNFKAMASQSFRVPGGVVSMRNFNSGKILEPEKATNLEVELGYRVFRSTWLSFNAYRVLFEKVIVYAADPSTGVGQYANGGKQGAYGMEADLRYSIKYVDLQVNYAYYTALKNSVENFLVEQDNAAYPGFANQRVTTIAAINLTKNIALTPSISYYGPRYGFTSYGLSTKKYAETAVVNVALTMRNIGVEGLDLYFGGHNILDKNMPTIQPYNGGHLPLPGESASVFSRLVFNF